MTTTTPHGQVPEALRLAALLLNLQTHMGPRRPSHPDDAHCWDGYTQSAAELHRLHAENEALRKAHVQNPAEIEHVAGDVSKNGAEVSVSTQQTAPATQQVGEVPSGYVIDLIGKLVQAESNKTRTHQEYMGKAMPDDVYARFQRLRDETIPALRTQLLDALAAAPQPSPTAQADSQPAPEYVGNGMFKGETIQKAAEHWANWCDRRCMNGLAEFLRVVAARAPADSVTAPAATPTAASIAWTALRDLTDPLGEAGVKIMGHVRIYAQRQYEAGLTEGRATPPAQAADSVMEDAARLDWLLLRISGAEFRRLGVHYSGNARRADVDAARKQGGA